MASEDFNDQFTKECTPPKTFDLVQPLTHACGQRDVLPIISGPCCGSNIKRLRDAQEQLTTHSEETMCLGLGGTT